MQSIDAAYCYRCSMVYVSVCVLVMQMCCAKPTEPVEMPFEELTIVGPGNHVLDGSQDPH